MCERNSSIFRKEAVENYIREQETSVLLHFISPRRFILLWIFFCMLLALGVCLCFTQFPTYTSGTGILVDCENRTVPCPHVCILALFPAKMHGRLKVGQRLMLKVQDQQPWIELSIRSVESKPLSPDEIRNTFSVGAKSMSIPTRQTAAVALCPLDVQKSANMSDWYAAEPFEVRVVDGSRRLASFLPLVGGFFQ